MQNSKINLNEKLAQFGDLWAPRTVNQLNDYDVMGRSCTTEMVPARQLGR